ncbi:maleylpyruvate isomerase family mycothiol-dependent enzyme [Streptomyces sp. NPDC004539]|uniref:maleylpyruvate isomerase family mycothiol-dependent enzyme n=1 Tax=Streptomyces sp. NPDC004539 TaxID=3154280 RepID=UPI0033BD3007
MYTPLAFPDLLRLIDERSAAFRAVVDSAPDLGVRVPSCPDWNLAELAHHIGEGRRRWALTVAAGPADGPAQVTAELPEGRAAVSEWLAESSRLLVDALREAGPEQECWTWWGDSQSPRNVGAVARHQLQQMAVHTYDAQLAVGRAEPLGAEIAVDGVDEFLTTCCATSSPWPHAPADVEFRVREGGVWRLALSGEGARVVGVGGTAATMTVTGSASQVVLGLYGRVGVGELEVGGESAVFGLMAEWEPE